MSFNYNKPFWRVFWNTIVGYVVSFQIFFLSFFFSPTKSARHATTGTGLHIYKRLCFWITLPCHDGRTKSQSCPRLDSPCRPLKFIILYTRRYSTTTYMGKTKQHAMMTLQQNGFFEKVRNGGGGGGGGSMPRVVLFIFFKCPGRWSWHNQRHSIRSALPFIISLQSENNVLA